MPVLSASDVYSNPKGIKTLLGLEPIKIDDIVVTILTEKTVVRRNEVTSHPVEKGYNVSNASISQPIELTMQCLFANPDPAGAGAKLALGSADLDGWLDKKKKLLALKEERDVVDVVTYFETFENMAITSISDIETLDTFNTYSFRIEFREVRVVESEVSTIDESQVPKRKREKKKDKHRKSDKQKKKKSQKGKKQPEQEKTIAASALDSIFG